MKVQVKEGKWGFYDGVKRRSYEGKQPADIFTLTAKKHSTQKTPAGKPVVISAKQQFSSKWMVDLTPDEELKPEAKSLSTGKG